MKISSQAILILSLLSSSLTALAADLKPVKEGTKAGNVAIMANDFYSVQTLKLGGKMYKFVAMSSELSGDTTSTTMLLVGDEVGGEVGYESAFVLTPADQFTALKSVKLNRSNIAVTLFRSNGGTVTKYIRYDSDAKVLKMR